MDKGLVEIEIGDKKMESAAIRTLLGIIKEEEEEEEEEEVEEEVEEQKRKK